MTLLIDQATELDKPYPCHYKHDKTGNLWKPLSALSSRLNSWVLGLNTRWLYLVLPFSPLPLQEFIDSPVYPVMVISYEMFVRSVEVIQRVNFDLVVCDEGHRLKNSGIKTTSVSGQGCYR